MFAKNVVTSVIKLDVNVGCHVFENLMDEKGFPNFGRS
jgi:hypothetical protein